EAAESWDAVREVDFLRFGEPLPLRRRHDRGAHRHHVVGVELAVLGRGHELPAHAHHRVAADLDVEIGGAGFDGNLQQIVGVHRRVMASSRGGRWGYRCTSTAFLGCLSAASSGYTYVSHPCVSGITPLMVSKNARWSASVTGPRRPLPI